MNVLVLNAGSSTLKFQLVRTDPDRMANSTDERLAKGQYDRIGGETILAVVLIVLGVVGATHWEERDADAPLGGPSHLLAGLLLGLAVDVHPNAVAFLPLFALLALGAHR